jgi:hypothetical protein
MTVKNIRRVRNKGSPIRAVSDAPARKSCMRGALKIENKFAVPRDHKSGDESGRAICAAISALQVGQSFVASRTATARQSAMFANWLFADREFICVAIDDGVPAMRSRIRVGRVK